jgi:hypothetical protein
VLGIYSSAIDGVLELKTYSNNILPILWPIKEPDPVFSLHDGRRTVAQELGFRLQFTSDQKTVGRRDVKECRDGLISAL